MQPLDSNVEQNKITYSATDPSFLIRQLTRVVNDVMNEEQDNSSVAPDKFTATEHAAI